MGEMPLNPKMLAEYMSNISEKYFCAGWMGNLEYDLWGILKYGEKAAEYELYPLLISEALTLQELSRDADGWVIWDDEVGEKFIPLEEWEKLYREYEREKRRHL
jgi:hypothetical protein